MENLISHDYCSLEAVYADSRAFGIEAARLARRDVQGWKGSKPADYARADISLCSEAAREYANRIRGGEIADLMICGLAGRGKTFTSLSVLKAVEDALSVSFASEAEAVSSIRSAHIGGEYEAEIARYTLPCVLVLDDLGKSKASEWTAATLFDLVNRRRERGKISIYTTQYDAKGLHGKLQGGADKETADAIASRLSMCEVIRLDGSDKRKRYNKNEYANNGHDTAN